MQYLLFRLRFSSGCRSSGRRTRLRFCLRQSERRGFPLISSKVPLPFPGQRRYAEVVLNRECSIFFSVCVFHPDEKRKRKRRYCIHGSIRPLHNDAGREMAEGLLRKLMESRGVHFVEGKNEAAFYGPKIDIQMKNANGKEDTAFTVQY